MTDRINPDTMPERIFAKITVVGKHTTNGTWSTSPDFVTFQGKPSRPDLKRVEYVRADLVPRQAVTGDAYRDKLIAECQHDARWQKIADAHIEAVIKWVFEYHPEAIPHTRPAVSEEEKANAMREFNQHLKYYDDQNGYYDSYFLKKTTVETIRKLLGGQ